MATEQNRGVFRGPPLTDLTESKRDVPVISKRLVRIWDNASKGSIRRVLLQKVLTTLTKE